MILDDLGLLRGDGSAGAISDTEAGVVDATDRDATTGQIVLDIKKTGKNGIPVVVITDPALVAATYDRQFVVTIQASDSLSDWTLGTHMDVVATFPATSATIADAIVTMVRRVHTQKRYLRSVITRSVTGTNGTCDFLIFITHGLMDT